MEEDNNGSGLLGFLKTPEGLGLLGTVFGGLAGAKRGQPLNSLGRAGLAGSLAYGYGLNRDEKARQASLAANQGVVNMDAIRNAFGKRTGGNAMTDGLGPTIANAANIGTPPEAFTPGGFLRDNPNVDLAGLTQAMEINKGMQKDRVTPMNVAPGGSLVNPTTGETIYTSQPTPNYNQAFNPDGTPNTAFQKYQRSLKSTGDGAGNKPPPGYRYTPNGDLKAIPGGPADIKEMAKSSAQETGRENVSQTIAALRDQYSQLEEGGGIPDPNKSTLANITAGISSSGAGQTVGRMFGTRNQSKRNEILMTRPALLQHIMKATGMSAKQMDSNAELKLWLSTATDPTLDISANMNALDRIEKTYGIKTDGQSPAPARQTASPDAVNMLKMNPKLAAAFDEKYGAGSAAKMLGR
ncbi:hypothetical protein UFOVP1470_25 [uncultured Caudovirales phage]|uniref:Uncharacterized protein n=1 Tax=uncultured Caudovirales phage TaxID=2100421 RepID=A0A6J5S1W7_9CAUD|nr:hypothetical protein UFOVP939_1 [uncultured Caudovirales phage]CAB4178567.1 hypothetical protein UFOVP1018_23 [uncultured Caudovirales phage]CAB4184014.1 hypothetical protein UFOVP1105_24 [uncultured Caudovirales phage]CAB4202448.1 hypothetical protein UFOVP1372_14 [uncultured Caudovirales phage]CAB4215016.1 hypothetical protein UFOVP1470_25 [uncultured Caudovirales phage]